ncbi:MAG: hypothetical protein WA919_20955 [Coleofasciculaceae cyanobacterium]
METNGLPKQSELPLILAVDHNSRNLELLKQFLEGAGFTTATASSLESLTQILTNPSPVRLALMDISGFERQISIHCQQMRLRRT